METKQELRNKLFLEACADGLADVAEFMLNAGKIDLNYLNEEGHSALWLAIHGGHISVAQLLLGRPGIQMQTLNPAFEEAHQLGYTELIQDLVEYPNGSCSIPYGQTTELLRCCNDLRGFNFDLLTAAIKLGNEKLAEKIIDVADIYTDTTTDFTPLVSAIERGNVNLVQKLLNKRGISINACGQIEIPPLLSAVKYPEIVKLLLKCSDLNLRRKDRKNNTALIKAVQENSFETVILLIESGSIKVDSMNKDASCFLTEESRLNLNNPYGDTPTACTDRTFGYQPLFGRRISRGDFETAGLTALQTAVSLGYSDIALYLIERANARVDIPLPGGIPLLFLAISQKLEAVAEAILQRLTFSQINAAILDPNNSSHHITALHVAFRARMLNIFKILLGKPIDINYGHPKDTILGEIFYVHRHSENVYEYMEALLKREDVNIHICTDVLGDNRTVFEIMMDENSTLLEYRPDDVRSAKSHTGYDWHC